ncbi:serine/threonine-protein kinase [Dactylosporangium sp. NPDC049140]|uniref:serine/threonine-protein kinase n=1 Tax=Dactylosporangium sp. NPDC049140 TaxID=3155647 RepID=UPI00340A460E
MGRVWRARDETLHRDVAVKQIVLPPELLDSARDVAMERTLREARAAARLSHPNVVRVYDVLAAEGQPWLVMEYVKSRSLDQVIREDGPVPPRRVAEIGLAVLDALRAAQRVGVDHRDIKPGNVLLAEDGRVVLTDFGIARVEGEGHVTRTGLVLGSPEFIAPERAREGIAGPASDLWSLGATLYAAVEGRSPFGRGSAMETLTALASEEADPPQRAGPLVPVLRALLRKDPRARADFAQTDELLRRALLPPEPPRKKRSWLGGWGRAETPAPVVPAQRTPPARPAARATPPAATPPAAAPAAASAPATPAAAPAASAAAPVAALAAEPVVQGKEEQPVHTGVSDKSGVIEGPVFGTAAEDEHPEPDVDAPEAATWVPVATDQEPAEDPTAIVEPATEAEPAAEVEEEPETEAVAEEQPETKAEAEPEPEPEPQPEPETFAPTRVEERRTPVGAFAPAKADPVPQRAAGSAAVVAPPPRTEQRRTGLLLGGAAAVLVVAALVWFTVRSDDNDPATQGTGATQTTAAPGPSAAGTSAAGSGQGSSAPAGNDGNGAGPTEQPQKAGTASGTLPPLPAGWVDYHDPTGFSVYVPQGWTKSQDGTMVYFRGGGRTLGVDQSDKPKMNPVADWTAQEQDRGGSYYKNYTRVRIDEVKNYFVVAADWEFTYGSSGRQHANNRGVVTSDHQAYGIWWSTSEGDWDSARSDLDIVFASFRPKP